MQFLKDVNKELKKMKWLSKKEAYKSTVAVVLTSFVVAIIFVIADMGMSELQSFFK